MSAKLLGCALVTLLQASPGPTITREDLSRFKPLPKGFEDKAHPASEARVHLGQMLFFDPRLSKNQDVSCNSCHALDQFGVDGKPTSEGHRKQHGTRNSPSVFNAAGHFAQFWDGRAADVEAQAKGPVENPLEMANTGARVEETLRSMPGYVEAFRKAFPGQKEPVTFDNAAAAIGAFERRLVTPSRFDQFLAGKKDALTVDEKRGFSRFVNTGCVTCHNGPAVGGNSFQKLGLVEAYPDQKDQGRFEVTKDEADRMKFRVPSLRNVAMTGPYFHNGSLTDLHTVVRTMAKHQLGIDLNEDSAREIEAFLKALTGEVPKALTQKPALPESTERTPKPDPS